MIEQDAPFIAATRSTMSLSDEPRRQRRLAIVLSVFFALAMVSLGVWFIVNGHAVGSTKRSVVVSFEGTTARWVGGLQASLGLVAMAVAMPSKTAALRWALAWLFVALVCLVAAFIREMDGV